MNSDKLFHLRMKLRERGKKWGEWNVSAVYANRHNESTTTLHQKVRNRRALYL